MSIFNSLGSNYTFETVIETLSSSGKEANKLLLEKFLEEKYGGKAVLFYKGREAIKQALRSIGKKDAAVGICGFTCYAVYDAVVSEGYDVEYLDVDESLQFTFETLQIAIKKNPKIKVLLIQNTLGYPCDIDKIAAFCIEKDIILIEDLAHSIGAVYENGKEAGTVGDFVILSFSQDKMIDAISGGALIIRNKSYEVGNITFKALSTDQQRRDRFYPLYTFLIRKTYAFGLGKVLHVVLKRKKMLTQPMEHLESSDVHSLPSWYCQLIHSEYRSLKDNLAHRKQVTKVYVETLNKKLLSDFFTKTYDNAANLRFPIFVPKRESLIHYLKAKHFYVSDIWYDAPIGPKKYMSKTNYNGECPTAEIVAERIVNLPTHKNISATDAKILSEHINDWLKKQA